MILRALQIEHWRCIGKLALADLSAGIVVLHGPNRTGKSSLVSALRSCLFDCDHDASSSEIKDSIPWSSTGRPKVVVEFSAAGQIYRLTKVFAKTKEGGALLEKQTDGQWRVAQDAPKEASRATREILGAEKSTGGMNKLLWLAQGETELPRQKDVDAPLQQKLVSVLGVLVTGRDFRFKEEVDRRYDRWFTAKTGNFKKDSNVPRLESMEKELVEQWFKEKTNLEKCQNAIEQLHNAEDAWPNLKRDVEMATSELGELELERDRAKDRVQKYRIALQAVEHTQKTTDDAAAKLLHQQEAALRLLQTETKFAAAQEEWKNAHAEKDGCASDHETAMKLLQAARLAAEDHRQNQQDLDDRRNLLIFGQRRAQLSSQLATADKKDQEAKDFDDRLAQTIVPNDHQLKELREASTAIVGLRAQLQAAALACSLSLKKTTVIRAAIDGQPNAEIEMSGGKKETWTLRQNAVIVVPDIGVFEVSRAHANDDIEPVARALANKQRDYQEAIRSFKEDPNDEECLTKLAEKRIRKQSWQDQREKLTLEMRQIAPRGRATLVADLIELERQKQIIDHRRPDLATWQPVQAEIDECQEQFKRTAANLESRSREAQRAVDSIAGALSKAVDAFNRRSETLAGAKATALAAREHLARLGDEKDLQSDLEQAKAALATAMVSLAENQLSEDEVTIDARCGQARTALEARRTRLRELEDQLTGLRGFLRSNEGLHTRLADAEASVETCRLALDRENLEASAHKRLRDLFEQCRENQVQQVMGPIAGRVLEWSKKIGLADYQEVRFGDNFLPQGIVLASRGAESPLAFDHESYGTSEQLSLLVRLALGGALAQTEPVVAILDDPLAHSDPGKHRRILDVLRVAAEGQQNGQPPAGRMQIIILTCHPERFDHLTQAQHLDLAKAITR